MNTINMVKAHTTEEIIDKFKLIHGVKFDYSNVEYKNNSSPIKIICKTHGEFKQTPAVHLRGNGCSSCSGKSKHTTEEIIKNFKKLYGDKYDYSQTEYKCSLKKFKVICKNHGEFETIYNNMLRGWACPKCTQFRKEILKNFLDESQETHGDEYDYSNVVYINTSTPVEIICKKHGPFLQPPREHKTGSGCQKCTRFTTSKIAQNWLKSLNNPELRTFDSDNGEFKIPETRWKVDGYDHNTNTIYEFHGDYWHAHPSNKRFSENEKHPRKKFTWGEIYKKTLERDQKIRDLGYNLVVIWEHEFLASLNNRRDRIDLYTS